MAGARLLAVAYGSQETAVSVDDGATWTDAGLLPTADAWISVAWNGSVYCAIALNTNVCATSPTGAVWTAHTLPVVTSWNVIKWNGTVFCAIAGNFNGAGDFPSGAVATSPDGITWTLGSMPSGADWQGLTWNGTVFCAVAGSYTSNQAATSTDGLNWTARTLPVVGNWIDVASRGSLLCAIMNGPTAGGTTAATSSDNGATWVEQILPVPINGGGSRPTGDNDDWNAIDANSTTFCIISYGSTSAATSTDGVNWVLRDVGSYGDWYAINWNGNAFVAVSAGEGSTGAYSPTGATWLSANLPSSAPWISVTSERVPPVFTSTGRISTSTTLANVTSTATLSVISSNPITGSITPHGSVDGGTLVIATPGNGIFDMSRALDSLSPYIPNWWISSGTARSAGTGTSLSTDTTTQASIRSTISYMVGNFSVTMGRPQISNGLTAQDLIVGSFGLYIDDNTFIRIEVFTNISTGYSMRATYGINGNIAKTAPQNIPAFPVTFNLTRLYDTVSASIGRSQLVALPSWSTAPAQVELRAATLGSPPTICTTNFTNFMDRPMLLSGHRILGNLIGEPLVSALQFITNHGLVATTVPASIHLPTQDISITGGWTYDDGNSLILASDGGQVLSVVNDPTLRQ
jgi:hypothetical protein